MHDVDVHAALVHMPAVSRALARGDALAAYRNIRRVASPIQAGRVLQGLIGTVPDWDERVQQWAEEIEAARRAEAHVTSPPKLRRVRAMEPTRQQMRCLALAADGLTNEEIGVALDLSVDTVKTHMKKALLRIGARNRTHACILALRQGYIQ